MAPTDFKAIKFRGIVAPGNHHSPILLIVDERKIESGSRELSYIYNTAPGGEYSADESIPQGPRGEPVIPTDDYVLALKGLNIGAKGFT